MANKPKAVGERIRRVRGNSEQKIFAKKIGLTQGGLSALERNFKGRTTSADVYFRIAHLAESSTDKLFFLERAGLSPQDLVSAANQFLGDLVRKPESGEIVEVKRVQSVGGTLKELDAPPVPMPAEMILNPGATYCFGIEIGERIREWAVVDTIHAGSEGLGLFLGLPILMELKGPGSSATFAAGTGFSAGEVQPGSLYLEEGENLGSRGIMWVLRFLRPHAGAEIINTSHLVGSWFEPDKAETLDLMVGQGRSAKDISAFRAMRAAQGIRLDSDYEVLGVILARWYPPQEHLQGGFPWERH